MARNDPAGVVLLSRERRYDRFRRRPNVAHDDGTPHGLGLDVRSPEGLGTGRSDDGDLRDGKGRRHVVAMTDQVDAAREAGGPDELLELAAVSLSPLRVTGLNEDGIAEPVLV